MGGMFLAHLDAPVRWQMIEPGGAPGKHPKNHLAAFSSKDDSFELATLSFVGRIFAEECLAYSAFSKPLNQQRQAVLQIA